MIVALCPLDNAFDTEANRVAIEHPLAIAAQGGATLALFPECGLTGFKARSDLSPPQLRAAWAAPAWRATVLRRSSPRSSSTAAAARAIARA